MIKIFIAIQLTLISCLCAGSKVQLQCALFILVLFGDCYGDIQAPKAIFIYNDTIPHGKGSLNYDITEKNRYKLATHKSLGEGHINSNNLSKSETFSYIELDDISSMTLSRVSNEVSDKNFPMKYRKRIYSFLL